MKAPLVHGIEPSSRSAAVACFNLALNGQLTSSDCSGEMMGANASHRSIESLSLEEIKDGKFQGVLSPSATVVLAAALARRNITLYNIDHPYNADHCQHRAAIEIEFEKIRRQVAPLAVSRLNCIWVAENSEAGRDMVRKMFLNRDIHLLDAAIYRYRRIFRADSTHYDNYGRQPHQAHAMDYWAQTASKIPKWEYLVDGTIQATDRNQVDQACLMHMIHNNDWWATNHTPSWFLEAVQRARLENDRTTTARTNL
jgi:hypothetical protein